MEISRVLKMEKLDIPELTFSYIQKVRIRIEAG